VDWTVGGNLIPFNCEKNLHSGPVTCMHSTWAVIKCTADKTLKTDRHKLNTTTTQL